jgi:hypothetical protein
MNRRHVLGLAAVAAVTTGCSGEKAAPLKSADLDPAVRKRMRALALTLLLTSQKLQGEFIGQDPASPKFGNGAMNHPFEKFNNPTDRDIFIGVLRWVNANQPQAKGYISQIGYAMGYFAGAAGVGGYMPPECPCQSGEYPDCPPIDALLA